MQCDEKTQICLNYAYNVPEWQLDMTLDALATLGEAVSAAGKVQRAVAGDLAWLRRHPDSLYLGTKPIDRVDACEEAASAFGAAIAKLEIILSQSDQFGYAFQLTNVAEAGYSTACAELKRRCRLHGCPGVAYEHTAKV